MRAWGWRLVALLAAGLVAGAVRAEDYSPDWDLIAFEGESFNATNPAYSEYAYCWVPGGPDAPNAQCVFSPGAAAWTGGVCTVAAWSAGAMGAPPDAEGVCWALPVGGAGEPEPSGALDWTDAAHVGQALFWVLVTGLGFQGFAVGARQ